MQDNNTTPNRNAYLNGIRTLPTPEMLFDTEQIEKAVALSHHVGCDIDDITPSDYDDMVFEADGEEYLVCTDEEADACAGDNIKNDLWAFNASFLLPHTILPCGTEDVIDSLVMSKYEDANPALEAMIPDMDALIEDAIHSDGRGHFLNFYDGGEYESNGFYIYQQ